MSGRQTSWLSHFDSQARASAAGWLAGWLCACRSLMEGWTDGLMMNLTETGGRWGWRRWGRWSRWRCWARCVWACGFPSSPRRCCSEAHTPIFSLGATDLFSLTQTQTCSSRGARNWQAFATPPGPRETLPQDYGQCKVCPPAACPSCQSCVICNWPPSYTSSVHATCGRGRDGAWNWMATTDQQPREPAQCFMCLVGVPDWAASRLPPLLGLSACCLLALWPPPPPLSSRHPRRARVCVDTITVLVNMVAGAPLGGPWGGAERQPAPPNKQKSRCAAPPRLESPATTCLQPPRARKCQHDRLAWDHHHRGRGTAGRGTAAGDDPAIASKTIQSYPRAPTASTWSPRTSHQPARIQDAPPSASCSGLAH